jgi:hypothetical protein
MANTKGKKPPASSIKRRRTKYDPVQAEIARELCRMLQRLDADEDFLAIMGSWRDTLTDEEFLTCLREFNLTGKVLHQRRH